MKPRANRALTNEELAQEYLRLQNQFSKRYSKRIAEAPINILGYYLERDHSLNGMEVPGIG